ncbi:hypothetical protein BC829DRAFT_418760 [Chytridium lagenaria]|nr:hypothetical protein BC829DRAFT_418760 [Chytridium lagenaria]
MSEVQDPSMYGLRLCRMNNKNLVAQSTPWVPTNSYQCEPTLSTQCILSTMRNSVAAPSTSINLQASIQEFGKQVYESPVPSITLPALHQSVDAFSVSSILPICPHPQNANPHMMPMKLPSLSQALLINPFQSTSARSVNYVLPSRASLQTSVTTPRTFLSPKDERKYVNMIRQRSRRARRSEQEADAAREVDRNNKRRERDLLNETQQTTILKNDRLAHTEAYRSSHGAKVKAARRSTQRSKHLMDLDVCDKMDEEFLFHLPTTDDSRRVYGEAVKDLCLDAMVQHPWFLDDITINPLDETWIKYQRLQILKTDDVAVASELRLLYDCSHYNIGLQDCFLYKGGGFF